MEKEKIQERLSEIGELLKEKQKELNRIESQQQIFNEKFRAMEQERRELLDSFEKLMGELAALTNEVKILKEKILQQN
ncbi:MAG: hypothetical protein FD156_192 [Nitrospirae bacterium]|nr:MAG: hypothetical protein FD156_192 [Nitrospirota bacterium]